MKNTPKNDLISLIEADLGHGKKSGRWMLYHCPFPGHKHGDRKPALSVTNGDGKRPPWWKCWACDRQGGAVRWLMEYRRLEYQEALRVLELDLPTGPQREQLPPVQLPDLPPSQVWQDRAWKLIQRAEDILWSKEGKDALAWLLLRGLSEETICAARIGYIPRGFEESAVLWGKPNDDPEPIKFFRGVLVPGVIGSAIWYLKMRPAQQIGRNKYLNVRGSKLALYQAETLCNELPAIFCEGEFDTLLMSQEARGLINAITLSSASATLNLANWGLYLLRPPRFLLALDADAAGAKGIAKLSWLHDAQRLEIPALKDGDKDITDFYKSGGDIRQLIANELDARQSVQVNM